MNPDTELSSLLTKLTENGITFKLEGDSLCACLPDRVPQDLMGRLRAIKADIESHLRQEECRQSIADGKETHEGRIPKNPYPHVSCRNCGRVTSRLQRVRAVGTGWLYQLCWPCYKKAFGILPPYLWHKEPEHKTFFLSPCQWNEVDMFLADFVLGLTIKDLPVAPFEFRQGETVIDVERFITAFQREVRYGKNHPRSRTGILQDDMKILWELLTGDCAEDLDILLEPDLEVRLCESYDTRKRKDSKSANEKPFRQPLIIEYP